MPRRFTVNCLKAGGSFTRIGPTCSRNWLRTNNRPLRPKSDLEEPCSADGGGLTGRFRFSQALRESEKVIWIVGLLDLQQARQITAKIDVAEILDIAVGIVLVRAAVR